MLTVNIKDRFTGFFCSSKNLKTYSFFFEPGFGFFNFLRYTFILMSISTTKIERDNLSTNPNLKLSRAPCGPQSAFVAILFEKAFEIKKAVEIEPWGKES